MSNRKAYTLPMRCKALITGLALLIAFGCGGDKDTSTLDEGPGPELVEGKLSIERSPEFMARLQKVEELLMLRSSTKARKTLRSLLTELPHDIEAHSLSAHLHWLNGRYDQAQKQAKRVLKVLEPYVRKNGSDRTGRSILSRTHMVLGDIAKSEVQLRNALRSGLKSPYAKDLWLSLLIQRENLSDQIELFDSILSDEEATKDATVCAARGLGLIHLDRMEEASELLQKCLNKVPSSNELKSRLQVTQGLVALRTGKLLKARDFFEAAIETSHTDADAHHALAVTMWRLRDVRARESLERALEIRVDPESAFLLGQVHTFNKRLDSAISQIKLALDHIALWTQPRSTRWQVPFTLGRLFARKGQYARAQQAMEQSLEFDPPPKAHREIYRHLVWVRQKSSTASAR